MKWPDEWLVTLGEIDGGMKTVARSCMPMTLKFIPAAIVIIFYFFKLTSSCFTNLPNLHPLVANTIKESKGMKRLDKNVRNTILTKTIGILFGIYMDMP